MAESRPRTHDPRAPIDRRLGYALVHAPAMRVALEAVGSLADWPAFAASWNDLEVDQCLDGQRPLPPAALRGLRDRWGRDDRAAAASAALSCTRITTGCSAASSAGSRRSSRTSANPPSLLTILRFCDRLFRGLAPAVARMARRDAPVPDRGASGRARPPDAGGVHRDGVDFVADPPRQPREHRQRHDDGLRPRRHGARQLHADRSVSTRALVDDNRVAHGVTPVAPLDAARPAHRDVLVVTFRKIVGDLGFGFGFGIRYWESGWRSGIRASNTTIHSPKSPRCTLLQWPRAAIGHTTSTRSSAGAVDLVVLVHGRIAVRHDQLELVADLVRASLAVS